MSYALLTTSGALGALLVADYTVLLPNLSNDTNGTELRETMKHIRDGVEVLTVSFYIGLAKYYCGNDQVAIAGGSSLKRFHYVQVVES